MSYKQIIINTIIVSYKARTNALKMYVDTYKIIPIIVLC